MARHQDDEKRTRILQSAIQAFGEKGFTTTTMKDIAEQADIAPGSIYTYFRDKEVLFISAVDTVWKQFHQGLAAILKEQETFSSQLDAMLDYGFDLLKELHPLVRGMYQEANRLNLFHKNLVKLAKQLSFFFERADENKYTLSRFDKRNRMYLLKVWISGMLFTLSSLPFERIDGEIERQKSVIRKALLVHTP